MSFNLKGKGNLFLASHPGVLASAGPAKMTLRRRGLSPWLGTAPTCLYPGDSEDLLVSPGSSLPPLPPQPCEHQPILQLRKLKSELAKPLLCLDLTKTMSGQGRSRPAPSQAFLECEGDPGKDSPPHSLLCGCLLPTQGGNLAWVLCPTLPTEWPHGPSYRAVAVRYSAHTEWLSEASALPAPFQLLFFFKLFFW